MPMSRACGGALGDELGDGEVVTGRREIGVVIGGQHGDGENAQAAIAARRRPPRFMVCG